MAAFLNNLNDEDRAIKFQQLSKEKLGNSHVKYCPLPNKALGRGISAIVLPGYHFGILKPVAVKYIEKVHVRQVHDEKEHLKELQIWSKIDQNTNIIRLHDSYVDPDGGIFLAMELAERTLKSQILEFSPPEANVIQWLYQVTSGVKYLHRRGVIHRDIKPENILMVKDDENGLIAKLADFGVSKMLSCMDKTSTFSNAHGTILWMAPEALRNPDGKFKTTRKLDIYALGLLMFFALSKGAHPFSEPGSVDVINKIVPRMISENATPNLLKTETANEESKLSLSKTAAANNLLHKMIQKFPEDRPQILEVISHCLFWNWEREQLFLIRATICLSRKGCEEIDDIKERIDYEYITHYQKVTKLKIFNWVQISKEKNFDFEELLFTSQTRKKRTNEYGLGESVTKFLKFFRDKYVHYPDMKPQAEMKFSEKDGSFCEEEYVTILTSICPGILAVLYSKLLRYANEPRLLPLSNIYFPWKLGKSSEMSQPKRFNLNEQVATAEVEPNNDHVEEEFEMEAGGSVGRMIDWETNPLVPTEFPLPRVFPPERGTNEFYEPRPR